MILFVLVWVVFLSAKKYPRERVVVEHYADSRCEGKRYASIYYDYHDYDNRDGYPFRINNIGQYCIRNKGHTKCRIGGNRRHITCFKCPVEIYLPTLYLNYGSYPKMFNITVIFAKIGGCYLEPGVDRRAENYVKYLPVITTKHENGTVENEIDEYDDSQGCFFGSLW